jgi:hypothetical protein
MNRETSVFAGAAGRVLWGALSVRSLISGLALGFFLLVGDGMLIYAGAHAFVTPFSQIVIALALARFVLNGQFGEWKGSLFSGVGGDWTAVLLVAARYLALTFLWLLPLMLLGLRVEQAAMGPAMMGDKAFVLLSIYILASALTPPLLLIASVAANDFGELFTKAHWHGLFGGRIVDLASIYAVYTGGVGMALLLCFPIVMLAFLPSWKLGVLFIGLAGCFLLGLALNLLGRLCGFFALGDFGDPEIAEHTQQTPPEIDRRPTGPPIEGDEGRRPAQPGISPPAAIPLSPAVATAHGLPALLDATERIVPIMKRFQTDPQGALGALEDLRQAFAPHPQVLVALCVCRHRTGAIDESVKLAQTVVPMCFDRGHVQLAAQVYKELRREVEQLGLNREQVLIVADALLKKGDLAGAGAAYSTVVGIDPGEPRAVKGLLQVAEGYLHVRSKPDHAIKVYEYLLKHCADSPLAEFMHRGLEQCRKRIPQPVG